MRYVISDSTQYLSKKHGENLTANLDDAIIFKTLAKAYNHLNTSLPKGLNKRKLQVITADGSKPDVVYAPNSIDAETITSSADEILRITTVLKTEHIRLTQLQQSSESEIQDIVHAAEFYQLNAAQGYKLYKMLHESRIRRREAKDGLELINALLQTKVSNCEDVRSQVAALSNRSYKPRILNELFGI